MEILIDAQLPPALARLMTELGYVSQHLDDISLTGATDREIWQYAEQNDQVIISKDMDFVFLRTLHPEGPSVIWLRIGNTRKKALLEHMKIALPEIIDRLAEGEKLVEVV